VRSEVARVAELGYRGQPVPDLSWSVTAFHTDYDDLRSVEIAPSGTSVVFANEMEGATSGVEMWGSYQVLPDWRLSAGYTAMNDRLRLKPGSNDVSGPTAVGKNPAHTWQLRSSLTIAANRELDIAVRHVAALSSPDVPAYTAVDARFGWRLKSNLELSLAGVNLLDADHGEYGPIETRSRIPRSIFVQLLWLGSAR
jgi:iron complex outermembrane receptor protein